MTTLPKLPDSIPVTANADGSPLPAESNVGRYRPRRKQGILTPSTVEDVQAVVRGFSGSALSLHAISTGRNWGLGSKEAAANDAARIELSGMREIRAINLDHGWAVIEPGVTQLDLAGKLAGTSRMLNVTASSGHTSVIGNTLDRGVGLYGPRINDLLGVEAVLPDGELVKIGWWPREDGTATALNIHGLGTSLLGLFSQSNLAVITGAVMRLHPRPEARTTLSLGIPESTLKGAVDTLRRVAFNGINRGVIKIYDSVANRSYGGASSDFTALLNIEGTTESVKAISALVKTEVENSGNFGSCADSTDDSLHGDTVFDVVHAAFAGDPSQNERMLRSAVETDADDVDTQGGGWLFFLPYIPFDGQAVLQARELLDQVRAETGVECGSTVNALDADVIDLVVTIRFTPNEHETDRAHRALDRLYELFTAHGFRAYRLDVDHASEIDAITGNAHEIELQRRLKELLDPRTVIAPGRYA